MEAGGTAGFEDAGAFEEGGGTLGGATLDGARPLEGAAEEEDGDGLEGGALDPAAAEAFGPAPGWLPAQRLPQAMQ